VTDELADEPFPDDPAYYFEKVARRIFIELPTDVALSDPYDAKVLFVGYANGKALSMEMTFRHTHSRFLPPEFDKPTYDLKDFNAFSGSDTILRRMDSSIVCGRVR
jgi:hypothetical protein